MNVELKKMIYCASTALLLVSCGQKKSEETVPPARVEEPQPTPPQNEKPLTPQEMDQLEIDEDNVMEPFPG